jgi:hypothetical protein
MRAPAVVRIAFVSRADEFARRDALRAFVLAGARAQDVRVVHRFFVARDAGWFRWLRWPWTPSVNARVRAEMEKHPDDVELLNTDENRYVLGKKRWAALRWVRCLPAYISGRPR